MGVVPAIGPINLGEDEIAVISALVGAILSLAGLMWRDKLNQIDRCDAGKADCETQLAQLRTAAQAMLESYQQRDAAELADLKTRAHEERD